MRRAAVVAFIALLGSTLPANAQSGGSFRVDAIINGQSQICIGATNIQYSLGPLRLGWRCGSNIMACYNVETIAVLPSQQRLYVTCTSTPPPSDVIFSNSYE